MGSKIAKSGELVSCPVPGCNHMCVLLTKNHCESAHGMERSKLLKEYGEPKPVIRDAKLERENLKMRVALHPSNFNS